MTEQRDREPGSLARAVLAPSDCSMCFGTGEFKRFGERRVDVDECPSCGGSGKEPVPSKLELARALQEAQERSEELEQLMRWMAQTVHQGCHMDKPGTFEECPRSVCRAATDALAEPGLAREPSSPSEAGTSREGER